MGVSIVASTWTAAFVLDAVWWVVDARRWYSFPTIVTTVVVTIFVNVALMTAIERALKRCAAT